MKINLGRAETRQRLRDERPSGRARRAVRLGPSARPCRGEQRDDAQCRDASARPVAARHPRGKNVRKDAFVSRKFGRSDSFSGFHSHVIPSEHSIRSIRGPGRSYIPRAEILDQVDLDSTRPDQDTGSILYPRV